MKGEVNGEKRRRRGTGREHTVREGVQRQGRSEHMEIDLHSREQMDRWEKRMMEEARWEMGRQREETWSLLRGLRCFFIKLTCRRTVSLRSRAMTV